MYKSIKIHSLIKKKATEPSKFVWENKDANTETSIEWKILDKVKSYEPGSRKCMLWLTEKYPILFSKLILLNSPSKLVTKCRHDSKFYLRYSAIAYQWQIIILELCNWLNQNLISLTDCETLLYKTYCHQVNLCQLYVVLPEARHAKVARNY